MTSPFTHEGDFSARTGRWIFAALVALLGLRIGGLLIRYDAYELATLFMADDSFYYLRIAQNIARGEGSTFDGFSVTNGYHPLWQLICIPLSIIGGNQGGGPVYAMLIAQALLILFALQRLYAGLSLYSRQAALLTIGLLIASFELVNGLLNGMESTIAFALCATLVQQALARKGGLEADGSRKDQLVLALLLIGISLSRLEAGLLAAIVIGRGLVVSRREGAPIAGKLKVLAALAVVGSLYMGINMLLVGLPLPISGLVKLSWDSSIVSSYGTHLSAFTAPVTPPGINQVAILSVLALVILGGQIAWMRTPKGREVTRRLASVWLFGLAFAALAIFKSNGGFVWYGWPAMMLGILSTFGTIAFVLTALADRLGPAAFMRTVGAASVVVVLLIVARDYRDLTKERTTLWDWGIEAPIMDAAVEFARELPRDEQLAGHSVGIVSYFLDRSIVQTEGLVNGRDYYDALKEGDPYRVLRERGVRWVLVNTVSDTEADGRLSQLFPRCAIVEKRDLGAEAARSDAPLSTIEGQSVVFARIDPGACSESSPGQSASSESGSAP